MPATASPRPRSEAQRAASRANGARSRGPRTAEGKARSARNAFRHGLYSPAILAPGEDPAAFERLLAELRAEYRPASPSEALLVERLAIAFWKLARCDRLEARLATIEPHCPPGRLWPDPGLPRLLSRVPELATLLRHQAQLGREVHRLTRLLATRPAPAPDPADPHHPEASDTDPPSPVTAVAGADHPVPPSSVMAGQRPGHPASHSPVMVGLRPDHPASSDQPVPWMAGSPAGHDAERDSSLSPSPVMVGPRAEHPAPPYPVMAGQRPGHPVPPSPFVVGPRAEHPASPPSSFASPAPHEGSRNEPEPTASNAARSGTARLSASAFADRHAGPSAAGPGERARPEGLPRTVPNVFLAREHRPDRERA